MGQVIRLSDHIETKTLKKELGELSVAIDDLAKKFVGIIDATKNLQAETAKGNTTQSETAKKIKEVNKSVEELTASEKEIQKIQKQSLDIQAKLIAGQKVESQTLEQLKQKKSEQNKQITETVKLQKAEKGSIDELTIKLSQLKREYSKLSEAERNSTKGSTLLKNIQETDKSVKGLNSTMGQHQANVGNYGSAFSKVGSILGGFGIAVGAVAIATKVFNGVMSSTQTLADGFEKTMIQAKEGVNFFFRAIATGDWKDFGKRFKEVMIAAGQYADTMDELGDLNRSFQVEQDKSAGALADLEIAYKNTALSEKERLKAVKDYLAIKKDLNDKTIKYAKDEYDATVKVAAAQIGVTAEKVKQFAEEYDKQKALLDVGKEYNKLVSDRNAIEKQIIKGNAATPLFSQVSGLDEKLVKTNKALADMSTKYQKVGVDVKQAGELQSKYQSSNDAMLQKVASSASKYYIAEAAFKDENIKAQVLEAKLTEEIKGKKEKATQSIITNNTKEKKSDDELRADQLKAIEFQTQEKINAAIDANNKIQGGEAELASEILRIQIESMQKQLEIANLLPEEKQAINTKLILLEAQRKQSNEKTEKDRADFIAQVEADIAETQAQARENAKAGDAEEIESFEEKMKKKAEIAEKYTSTINQIGQMAFETQNVLLETESQNLEQQYQYRLSLAGDNEAAKAKVEKDYDKKKKELMRKQAQADKNAAMFNALINTAQGITAALKLGVPGIILAVLIGILGAVQIASIASRPIPQFYKGLKDNPKDQFGIVGDAPGGGSARELIEYPSGQMELATTKQMKFIPKGANIYTNYETEKMLAGHGGVSESKLNEIVNEQRATRQAISNQTIHQTIVTEKGFEYATISGTQQIKWINKYMNR
jgi:hypothetical protein